MTTYFCSRLLKDSKEELWSFGIQILGVLYPRTWLSQPNRFWMQIHYVDCLCIVSQLLSFSNLFFFFEVERSGEAEIHGSVKKEWMWQKWDWDAIRYSSWGTYMENLYACKWLLQSNNLFRDVYKWEHRSGSWIAKVCAAFHVNFMEAC